jgi:serine/threonine protein phosphatase PrpC
MHYEFNEYFRGAGLTNPGHLRRNNEDNFLIDSDAGLLVVADGMGGHQSGELASADAIRVIQRMLTGSADGAVNHSRVADAIAEANGVINRRNRERGYAPREAMGTTIVGLYFQPERPLEATVFHVGDSRFYRYRNGALDRVTRDHSAYESWLAGGGNGPAPGLHVLSQAIGPAESVIPAIQQQTFRPGDIVLLCSDGLTNLVSDDAIKAILQSVETGDLPGGCHALIEAAQANGGTDNITVVLGAFVDGAAG